MLMDDVIWFLLRKDLLFLDLVNFNDKFEFYCVWKYSF